MGAVLDLLRQAAATLASRRTACRTTRWSSRERRRRGALGRQFPRRAGRLRRRHDGHRALRDRLAFGAAHRHADGPGAVRSAGVPDAATGPQLRLHDRAGNGGGAGLREQAARLSGQRRFDPDLAPTRRITCRWRRMPRGGCAHGGERRACRRRRDAGRRTGVRFPCADARRAVRWSACARSSARACRHLEDDRYLAPDIAAAAETGAVGRACRRGRGTSHARVTKDKRAMR